MPHITVRRLLLPLLALALMAFAVSCGGEGGEKKGDDKGSASKGPQTIDVVMKDNVFEPKTYTVSTGQVTFNVKNDGANMHNFHIVSDDTDPKNATTQVMEGGKAEKLTVKFAKKGTYKFQCDLHVPDMAGTITVN